MMTSVQDEMHAQRVVNQLVSLFARKGWTTEVKRTHEPAAGFMPACTSWVITADQPGGHITAYFHAWDITAKRPAHWQFHKAVVAMPGGGDLTVDRLEVLTAYLLANRPVS
jgi:hypothetical protein